MNKTDANTTDAEEQPQHESSTQPQDDTEGRGDKNEL